MRHLIVRKPEPDRTAVAGKTHDPDAEMSKNAETSEERETVMTEKDERFHRLCRDELPILRGGVYRIVGNIADTDDVIQEALLRAYRSYDSFRSDAKLVSWVYRIAQNCAFDLLRKRKRQAAARENYSQCGDTGGNDDDAERLEKLESAVAKLPELYREAVVWGCLSDLPGRDAAQRLGCTENTLYQRVFKAKQMLKKMLKTEDDDER